jgi:hypothetical protein
VSSAGAGFCEDGLQQVGGVGNQSRRELPVQKASSRWRPIAQPAPQSRIAIGLFPVGRS